MTSNKLKVLVVDDDRDLLEILSTYLSHHYEVQSAESGERGLEVLREHHREIVCVISDFNMRGMNGLDMRREMIKTQKDIPFVLFSGFITKDDALQAIDARISAFESKPLNPQTLVGLIQRVSADRDSQIRERDLLEQIFIEEASNIVEELESLIMSLESNPRDMEVINTIFRLVHTIKGSSGVLETTHIRSYVHKYEDLLSKLKSGERTANSEIVSILLQGFDVVGQMIAGLKCGEVWTQNVDELAKIFTLAPTTQAVTQSVVEVTVDANPQASTGAGHKETVAVPSALLDEFMELSGEITVIRNMVNKLVRVIEKEHSGNKNVQHLGELLDEMHKINSGMQGRLIETRKVPCAKIFKPIQRIVRDTSKGLGKKVQLKTIGDVVLIDTSLAQVLSDSLTHIVRNSIDHGIELPEVRTQRRKSPEGSITIQVSEHGEEVLVSIRDDGGGLDVDRIRAKAIERGLFAAEEIKRLSDQRIFGLIFESGFSTAAKVSDVSGRGVGMDMVRASVQNVKGRIEIDSKKGEGTQFLLRLPIPKSVLIVSSLVVDACGQTFALPQDSIVRLLRLEGARTSEDIQGVEGGYLLHFENHLIPILDLGVALKLRKASDVEYFSRDTVNLIVVKTDKHLFALSVDAIMDAEEIVVKAAGKHIERTQVYIGATFMGDGSVGLILSVDGLAEVSGMNASISDDGSIDSKSKSLGSAADSQEILSFKLFCNGTYAVPLSLVHRLEEFSRASFQQVGDRIAVMYRDQIMPVIDLSKAMGLKLMDTELSLVQDPVPMIVLQLNERYIGFTIRNILDVTAAPILTSAACTDRPEIVSAVEVGGSVISLLDLVCVARKAGLLKVDATTNLTLSKAPLGRPPEKTNVVPINAQAVEETLCETTPEGIAAGQGWGIF